MSSQTSTTAVYRVSLLMPGRHGAGTLTLRVGIILGANARSSQVCGLAEASLVAETTHVYCAKDSVFFR